MHPKLALKKKKRSQRSAALKTLMSKRKKLRADEEQLQAQVEELEEITPELEQAVEENADALAECEGSIADLEEEIAALDEEIAALEAEEPAEDEEEEPAGVDAGQRSRRAPAQARAAAPAQSGRFSCRSRCFESRSARDAFYARSEVRTFLQNVRALAGSGRRSVTGAEVAIPTVVLDLMRDNVAQYSKLINLVRLVPVSGRARQGVLGKIPEGIWTEMCANLNEINIEFTEAEMDGFMVGGFIPICNSVLKDSDIALGEELIAMLLACIGYALDKAIVYGTGVKMPVGIMTRLAQTSQPAYWGINQGTWTDLHSSHVLQLNLAGLTGTAFFQPLLAALGKADPKFTPGESFYVMNRQTHMDILGRGLSFDAAGALVAGFSDKVPVEGGTIVELDFIPDGEIIGGFGGAYLLVEREGGEVAQSEHVRFLANQTVFRGTARYDGQPVIGEAFVALNYKNQAPTTSVAIAPDYANTALNALICTAAAGTAAGDTVVTVSGAVDDSPTLKYAVGFTGSIENGGTVGSAFKSLTSGTTQITAAAGAGITVVELNDDNRVVSVGNVISVPKT